MKRLLIALSVFVCMGWMAQSASAFDHYRGNSSGLPYWGYGFSGSLYGLGYVPVPPYYALHPPVHYSRRVSVPYGSSPYARDLRPAPPKSKVIINYLAPQPKPDLRKSSGMIENPYYVPESPSDEAKPAEEVSAESAESEESGESAEAEKVEE